MTTFNLTINLGNDAMQTPADIKRALERLTGKLATGVAGYEHDPTYNGKGIIRDANGNRVGQWAVSEPESAEAIAERVADANPLSFHPNPPLNRSEQLALLREAVRIARGEA